jgi:hypothetical protein
VDREYLIVEIDTDKLSTFELSDLIERVRAMKGVTRAHTIETVMAKLFPEEEKAK